MDTKCCNGCHITKPTSEFRLRYDKRNGKRYGPYVTSRCKKCLDSYISTAYMDKRRAWITTQKNVPCADCGVRYPPCVMDFDHRDPSMKSFQVGRRLTQVSIERLTEEIAKCDVVCANCHRLRTFSESVTSRPNE